MKKKRFLLAMLALLLASGCATGPKLSEVQSSLPTTPADQGRIYFYRTSVLGAAVQPTIFLNDLGVGGCVVNGVFFRDMPPGDYRARVATEVERQLTFTLEPGEEKFVRCYVSLGFFIGHGNLELVDPAAGRAEIQNLSYTGGVTK